MEKKLISCPLCLHPHFVSVDSLRTALISVASAPIPCPICSDVLMGLDKLTIHLFSHVTISISINNPDINQLVNAKELYVEKQLVPLLPKTQHEETATTKNSQQDHSKDPPIPNDSSIQCDICNFRFNDQSILEMHQKLLHQTLADSKTGACSYHCHLCSKRFKMKGSLMVHLRVAHAGFGCESDTCQKSTNNEEGIKVTSGVKQWACDICEKTFTTKYFLKKHKRLHTGEMPYFCSQCNKSFTFQQSFHKHMMYHTADKPHICPECNRAFKELSTLQNHQRIHSGERPFACETCGKCFRQRVSYLVHRRIHTGAMPYTCNVCNKSFRYKVSQKSHKCTIVTPNNASENELLTTKTDANALLDFNNIANELCTNRDNGSNELLNIQVTSNAEGTAYYAMVFSPTSTMLPDVQSLCLTSDQEQLSPTECQNDFSSSDVTLGRSKTIDEESLKQLLQGTLQ